MGIGIQELRFLLRAYRKGVDFSRTAMIGRQGLGVYINEIDLQKNLKDFGFDLTLTFTKNIVDQDYAEPLFQLLGAKDIFSFDASNYEGANTIHDFNQPIPKNFHNYFTVVVDGGSLEHIFNFPQAIKNCMQMVKLNGYYLGITPTNNFSGHGFYQFSPEIWFHIFSPNNGFSMHRMLVSEEGKEWIDITNSDPTCLINVVSQKSTLLMFAARKDKDVPLFSKLIQQGHYEKIWTT